MLHLRPSPYISVPLATSLSFSTLNRYPTRTRNFLQYPIHTRLIFKIFGYFGYKVLEKTRFLTWTHVRLFKYWPFFHHYQGSIDFNTVNIHRTVGMYFLVSTGNRGDIEWHDLQRSYYPIHSLLPGVYVSILSLRTVFPRTLPMANIRNTSSRGKHWQCSSNDADKLNVDICRQAKRHYIGCTI